MDALSILSSEVPHLKSSFDSAIVIGTAEVGMTQYILWMIIRWLITLAVVMAAAKKLTLVPSGKFSSIVEYGYNFVAKDMGEGVIGHGYKKHVPFLATLFFFILLSNFVGLIPGCKPPTGTISVTWALATISFFYFNYYGIKAHGGIGYIKSLAPSGLPAPMVPVIWFFELISLILRWLTLAVRLYGNMFAGHMVLGIFIQRLPDRWHPVHGSSHRRPFHSVVPYGRRNVCTRDAGCVPSGIRFHHPERGLHQPGHVRSLRLIRLTRGIRRTRTVCSHPDLGFCRHIHVAG